MERKFQIFISSTYVDLIEERQEVTRQILSNFHFPVGMEMFAPSDKEQWEIIKKTIDSSDIYILLLGYRYGSTLQVRDGESERVISYTEKEFEYAVKRKIPVIVFLKDDNDLLFEIKKLEKTSIEVRKSSETWRNVFKNIYGVHLNTSQIERLKNLETGADVVDYVYHNSYDSDQSRINAFRSKVQNRLVGKFSRNKKIDVQTAIAQRINTLPSGGWVKEKQIKKSYLIQPTYLFLLISLLVAVSGITYLLCSLQPLRNKLVKNDHNLFDVSPDSSFNLEFARVFPDSKALTAETEALGRRISATKDSFSINTTTFSRLKESEEEIRDGIKRGVKFRILLLDTSRDNYDNINRAWFYYPVDSIEKRHKRISRDYIAENIINISSYLSLIKKYPHIYKGKIELRFSKRPQYYNLWISDPARDQGIAHLALSAYDGFKPVFRVTKNSSARLFDDLNIEFNRSWDDPTNTVVLK